jgi:hypothetical protein
MVLKQAEEPTTLEKFRSALRERLRPTRAWGRRAWAIPGGHIPLRSGGEEPRLTSRDEVCILNVGPGDAKIEIIVFYADREPVGPYRVTVPARRTRHIRFNDLIDPEAIPLDTDFAALVESSAPVVVHFARLDSEGGNRGMVGSLAYPIP